MEAKGNALADYDVTQAAFSKLITLTKPLEYLKRSL